MRIIFHLGAHKTASTHLQFNFALNRKYLNQRGIAYFRFQEIEGLQQLADDLAAQINRSDFDIKSQQMKIQSILEEQISGYEVAVISYEGCLGYHNHLDFENIYPYTQKIARVYQEILKDHEVFPVYAVRNYDDYLVSTYQQELGHGIMNATINQYFSNKNLTDQRWTEIVESLKNTFSGEIRVFSFDEYKKYWKEICLAILALTGKEMSEEKLNFEISKKNDSKSNHLLKFNYTLNQVFNKIPEFKYKKAVYYRTLKHILPLFDSKMASGLMRNYQKNDLPVLVTKEKYEEEYARLKEKYALIEI